MSTTGITAEIMALRLCRIVKADDTVERCTLWCGDSLEVLVQARPDMLRKLAPQRCVDAYIQVSYIVETTTDGLEWTAMLNPLSYLASITSLVTFGGRYSSPQRCDDCLTLGCFGSCKPHTKCDDEFCNRCYPVADESLLCIKCGGAEPLDDDRFCATCASPKLVHKSRSRLEGILDFFKR